jgi:hypothetical protein
VGKLGWQTAYVKRERAVGLVEELLGRLVAGVHERPLSLITDVYVFGSFSRGAVEPHDVDVAVKFERDWEWGTHFATCLSYGRNPYSVFRAPLIGRRPGIQFIFEPEHLDFEMIPLWHRGDGLSLALARLHAITPDPTAGRAPRDAMLPQFVGLDRWIPLAYREAMAAAVSNQIVRVERLTLPDQGTDDSVVMEHLRVSIRFSRGRAW